MITAEEIHRVLESVADPVIAEHSRHFFKTGEGEYGEGDLFHGIRVPVLRKYARKYQSISLAEARHLLASPFHEERFFALLVLMRKFEKGDSTLRETIYTLYLDNLKFVNNWDLVDISAPYIVGPWLEKRDKGVLYRLAQSEVLWERRVAILSTFHCVRKNNFNEALTISELLIHDPEDLIHKAVGWVLREIGKRNVSVEKAFLGKHYRDMPRTMLRYAIERFPKGERKKYLQGTV
ncbi:DNA alkylation repair protein [Prosthecochloris sp. SCSIO W1101]|uniref:DNA alkylation repair protein n=1 Tax=Prosthecochloris sp. SCSIO W1101 TaxID=2992242 RepID=UPI00223DDFB4|nr:DNA alkylation repair protein [Prosthecochloris sp. SCSIO W1101]UZJ40930.1 DNA alkylation repair protein [Prosthecochloris sp. SCSIO W1101]